MSAVGKIQPRTQFFSSDGKPLLVRMTRPSVLDSIQCDAGEHVDLGDLTCAKCGAAFTADVEDDVEQDEKFAVLLKAKAEEASAVLRRLGWEACQEAAEERCRLQAEQYRAHSVSCASAGDYGAANTDLSAARACDECGNAVARLATSIVDKWNANKDAAPSRPSTADPTRMPDRELDRALSSLETASLLPNHVKQVRGHIAALEAALARAHCDLRWYEKYTGKGSVALALVLAATPTAGQTPGGGDR